MRSKLNHAKIITVKRVALARSLQGNRLGTNFLCRVNQSLTGWESMYSDTRCDYRETVFSIIDSPLAAVWICCQAVECRSRKVSRKIEPCSWKHGRWESPEPGRVRRRARGEDRSLTDGDCGEYYCESIAYSHRGLDSFGRRSGRPSSVDQLRPEAIRRGEFAETKVASSALGDRTVLWGAISLALDTLPTVLLPQPPM